MAASKQFLAALAKKKKQFTKARKAKPSAFGIPEIDNGTYVARLSASIATRGDENTIVVTFPWTVDRGAKKGTSHRVDVWLSGRTDEEEQASFDDLSRRLQVLGYDMDEIELSKDLPGILEEIAKDKPLVRIGLKNGESKTGTKYLGCYFNELLDDEDAELDEEEEEDEEDESEEEEEEETATEEEGDSEEEEEEEYESIDKGMNVKHKRKTYVVTISNQRKETCTLKQNKTGTLVKDVPWADVIVA